MKKTGHCTVCDKRIFDEKMSPESHAVRRTLILIDGSQCDITTCHDCLVTPANIADVWKKCVTVTAYQATNGYRSTVNTPDVPLLDLRQQLISAKGLLWLLRNVPIGNLHCQHWTEILNG